VPRPCEEMHTTVITERNGDVRNHPVPWLGHILKRPEGLVSSQGYQMSNVLASQLEAWEGEGGATERPDCTGSSLRGTDNQVEWALRIRRQINQEFDRVAAAFRVVSHRQKGQRRTETVTIIDILEEKRLEVMRNEEAGYFIRGWQEIGDQVRQLIFEDARYQAIKSNWRSR